MNDVQKLFDTLFQNLLTCPHLTEYFAMQSM